MIEIKYIGFRKQHVDGTYGSKLVFNQGESKEVDDTLGLKLLRHADCFEKVGESKEQLPEIVKEQVEDEDDVVRDQIIGMDKKALEQFAKFNFQVDLDMRKSEPNLRQEVLNLFEIHGSV